jgi:PBP1b-binding outer membrane lipoprotein LpoB
MRIRVHMTTSFCAALLAAILLGSCASGGTATAGDGTATTTASGNHPDVLADEASPAGVHTPGAARLRQVVRLVAVLRVQLG